MRTPATLRPGTRAWLLLDIDGVLSPFVSRSQAKKLGLRTFKLSVEDVGSYYAGHRFDMMTWVADAVAQLDLLTPAWCTSWWLEADTMIGNRVGLGPWPTVQLGYYEHDPAASKVTGITELVGSDPFVWIDDDPGQDVDELLAALPNDHLFLRTRPDVGLTPEHLERASAWAAALPV